MRITGPQMKQLRDALLQAFAPGKFDDMLLFQLNVRRTNIATVVGDQETIVLDVIKAYNYKNKIEELLIAARKSNPNDPDLSAFARQFKGATQLPAEISSEFQLERTIRRANGFVDAPHRWREKWATIENQICRIEISTSPPTFGTGFLVGSDVVITNYHVMEQVIKGQIGPEQVKLRFDFALLSDGCTPNPGTVYDLTREWLIDHSEFSELDNLAEPGEEPAPNQLDYVLLRVAGAPGKEPVGGDLNKDVNMSERGWIKPMVGPHNFAQYPAVMIMQHPDGNPLKLAFDTAAFISINTNKTRVRYTTNTEGGSSGSPCFDINWNLIALHHGGDPNFSFFHKPTYNQGIPFTTILELLEQRDKKHELDR